MYLTPQGASAGLVLLAQQESTNPRQALVSALAVQPGHTGLWADILPIFLNMFPNTNYTAAGFEQLN